MRISDWSSDVCSSDLLTAGHVMGLGGGVDDLVDRLHGEVEGHELDDGPEAVHRRADAEAGEAVLGDRRVDHAARAELVEQAQAHLVGALEIGRGSCGERVCKSVLTSVVAVKLNKK